MSRGAGRSLLLLGSYVCLLASCAFPGSVPETVKIGLSAPFEGLYRDLGYEALSAVRLAVHQVNAEGGIGEGLLVELVALNDMNEPREAAAQAGEMEVDPDILGVIGGLSPRTADASGPEYEARGLAFVTPFGASESLGEFAAQAAARTLGAHTAVVLCGADTVDLAQAEGFAKAFVAEGGEVLLLACPQEGEEVAALLSGPAESPDLLFLTADAARAAGWIVELRATGYTGAVLGGPEVGGRQAVRLAGHAGEGIYFASPFPAGEVDAGFGADYAALSGGVAPRGVAIWCYSAARDLLDAMDRALESGAEPARQGIELSLAEGRSAKWPMALYAIHSGEPVTVAGSP